jgi:leader peptidase (prepilin peptidase)/N-methyltransferase
MIPWYNNIPVFSWLALGGKCGNCKAKISIRYPFTELLTALIAIGAYSVYGLSLEGCLVFIYLAALIVISFIDYDYFIIPDTISIPGTMIGLILAAANGYFSFLKAPFVPGITSALWGLVWGAGLLYTIAKGYEWIRKEDGLGFGDVKLLAMCGVFFGPECCLYTIFVGSVVGAVFGILGIIIFRRGLKQEIPFGPYLNTATALYLLTGEALPNWWFGLIAKLVS